MFVRVCYVAGRRKDAILSLLSSPKHPFSCFHSIFQRKREATMALRMITEKAMGVVAKQYQAALGASLAQTGEYLANCFGWLTRKDEKMQGSALGIGGGRARRIPTRNHVHDQRFGDLLVASLRGRGRWHARSRRHCVQPLCRWADGNIGAVALVVRMGRHEAYLPRATNLFRPNRKSSSYRGQRKAGRSAVDFR